MGSADSHHEQWETHHTRNFSETLVVNFRRPFSFVLLPAPTIATILTSLMRVIRMNCVPAATVRRGILRERQVTPLRRSRRWQRSVTRGDRSTVCLVPPGVSKTYPHKTQEKNRNLTSTSLTTTALGKDVRVFGVPGRDLVICVEALGAPTGKKELKRPPLVAPQPTTLPSSGEYLPR